MRERESKAKHLQYLTQTFRVTGINLLHESGSGHWRGSSSAAKLIMALAAPIRTDQISINDTYCESLPYLDLMEKYGISSTRIFEKSSNLITS